MSWTPSQTPGCTKQHIVINAGGRQVAYALTPEVGVFALDVLPNTSGSFKISTFGPDGVTAIDSDEFSFTVPDAPADNPAPGPTPAVPALLPATGLGFQVLQWVDAPADAQVVKSAR